MKKLLQNKSITALDIENSRIYSSDFEQLINNENIVSLCNNVNTSMTKFFDHDITWSNKIVSLDIANNKLKDNTIISISKITSLTNLNISNDNFTIIGCQALSKNKTLISLNISNNNINIECIIEISKILTLTSLDISESNISGEHIMDTSIDGFKHLIIIRH